MTYPLLHPDEIDATIESTIACCAWLWRHDAELAIQMRDNFRREWDVDGAMWNDACDRLIDYAIRKGEGPAPQASFEAVRI